MFYAGVLDRIDPTTGKSLKEMMDRQTYYHTLGGQPWRRPYAPYNEPPKVSVALIEDCAFQKSACQGNKPYSDMDVGGPTVVNTYALHRGKSLTKFQDLDRAIAMNKASYLRTGTFPPKSKPNMIRSSYPLLHDIIRREMSQYEGDRYGNHPRFLETEMERFGKKSAKTISKIFHQLTQEVLHLQRIRKLATDDKIYPDNKDYRGWLAELDNRRANLQKIQIGLAALYDQKSQSASLEEENKRAIASGQQDAADAQALREVELEHYMNLYGISDPIEVLSYKEIERKKFGKTSYEALLAGETFKLGQGDTEEVMEITADKKENILQAQESSGKKKTTGIILAVGGIGLLAFLLLRKRRK